MGLTKEHSVGEVSSKESLQSLLIGESQKSEGSSKKSANRQVVKIETVKYLQAIDSYLRQLDIKSDKEIVLG